MDDLLGKEFVWGLLHTDEEGITETLKRCFDCGSVLYDKWEDRDGIREKVSYCTGCGTTMST